MKIYIASSWKNQHAVEMLTGFLRQKGHEVLSFVENNFGEGNTAKNIVPFETWVKSPSADRCFQYDSLSAQHCDLVIYVGPSGKDAAAECGMAYGAGVPLIGLWAKGEDFGLMRKMFVAWYDRFQELLHEVEIMADNLRQVRA